MNSIETNRFAFDEREAAQAERERRREDHLPVPSGREASRWLRRIDGTWHKWIDGKWERMGAGPDRRLVCEVEYEYVPAVPRS